MAHQCIKTGCLVYILDYGEWVYGDAHMVGNVLIIHVAGIDLAAPKNGKMHFAINKVDYWPDRNSNRVEYSILMATDFINYGYEGVEVPQ